MRTIFALSACILLSCNNNTITENKEAVEAAVSPSSNKVVCTVDGITYTALGDKVEIGSFGATDKEMSFALSMNTTDNNGNWTYISTGLMKLPFVKGTYNFPEMGAPGYNQGEYKMEDKNGALLKKYTGGDYFMYYATDEINDEQVKLKFIIDFMEVSPAKAGDLPTIIVKMKGQFMFSAARLIPEKMSDECTKEAIVRGLKGGKRFPMYDGDLCGAEKKRISGQYEIETTIPVVKAAQKNQ
jgi:hypothetical protein